ncbi:unnamed protein product [Pleuronectes platessa]|uniref:Uncharacterized protein n=1 Tax=Pleuronectes platessa TaxID=8262 RepID=A0A9N7Z671_PLEPL|nr:unnamed protein product [Pleuronectes platessa]
MRLFLKHQQGTVSSIRMNCLVLSKTKKMSGLSDDWVYCHHPVSCCGQHPAKFLLELFGGSLPFLTNTMVLALISLRLSARVTAHLAPKAFHHGQQDFIYEQRPEDSWEDPVLVDPGFPGIQTCPQTKDRDIAGLKLMHAHDMSFSRP